VVPVPINMLLTPEQIAYVLAESWAEAAVISTPLLPVLEPVRAAPRPRRQAGWGSAHRAARLRPQPSRLPGRGSADV